MLDTVPANKLHGFGGDFLLVEGSYGHAQIARREIARVLCEKVEKGRFSEEYALQVGRGRTPSRTSAWKPAARRSKRAPAKINPSLYKSYRYLTTVPKPITLLGSKAFRPAGEQPMRVTCMSELHIVITVTWET